MKNERYKTETAERLEVVTIFENETDGSGDYMTDAGTSAETVEQAREIIAERRTGKPAMSDDDREYWRSKKYAVRRVTTVVEYIEVSHPDGTTEAIATPETASPAGSHLGHVFSISANRNAKVQIFCRTCDVALTVAELFGPTDPAAGPIDPAAQDVTGDDVKPVRKQSDGAHAGHVIAGAANGIYCQTCMAAITEDDLFNPVPKPRQITPTMPGVNDPAHEIKKAFSMFERVQSPKGREGNKKTRAEVAELAGEKLVELAMQIAGDARRDAKYADFLDAVETYNQLAAGKGVKPFILQSAADRVMHLAGPQVRARYKADIVAGAPVPRLDVTKSEALKKFYFVNTLRGS